jgi:rubredoxin
MIIGKETTRKGTKKELRDYSCGFCGFKFQQYVCKSGKQGKGKRGDISTQVKCPKCSNFLKTWEV